MTRVCLSNDPCHSKDRRRHGKGRTPSDGNQNRGAELHHHFYFGKARYGCNAEEGCEAVGRTGITVHGFRATFRTWADEEMNFSNQAVEFCLAHVPGDEAVKAYRRGSMLKKREQIMTALASFASVRRASIRRLGCENLPLKSASWKKLVIMNGFRFGVGCCALIEFMGRSARAEPGQVGGACKCQSVAC
jgi:hypothetical protein